MTTSAGDPADRGRLEIAPIVLRRIVEQAADAVPGTMRHERRLAGIDVGGSGASARVTVGAAGPTGVDVRLDLVLQYPAVIAAVIDAVRARVGEDLERLAGHQVRALAVTVSGLRGAPVPTVSRLR